MNTGRRASWPLLLLLLILVSVLAWPAHVLGSTALALLNSDAWQLQAWPQIPKRLLLQHFLDGYRHSLVPALCAGVLAVIDYLLLSPLRITRWFRGILLPLAGAAIAMLLLKTLPAALPALIVTGLLLAVAYRLVVLLAGRLFRGSLH